MKPTPADHRLAQFHECFMDIIASLVADAQASILMHPTQRTLHWPAIDAQAAAVRRITPGQQWFDASFAQRLAVRFRVISTIRLHDLKALSWSASLASHR